MYGRFGFVYALRARPYPTTPRPPKKTQVAPLRSAIREELDSALPEDPDGREGQVYNFDALDYVGNGLILASEDEETTLLESGDEEEWTVDSVVQNI
ncbi:hypothetical protein NMY22_g6531 [Coprinellus aureogranulatus]|nr:hypothetical protein NMY22_g6531 [Coprinellus aureogranulatus]